MRLPKRRHAVQLAGKAEEPSGKVEQQTETDTAEKFQAHIAVACGLRGKGEGNKRHHPCGNGIYQLAPPCDGIDLGILVVFFQMVDVGGQFADRHLVGLDEQYIHQVAFDGNRPVFFSGSRNFDFIFAQYAAADIFQLPAAVWIQNG